MVRKTVEIFRNATVERRKTIARYNNTRDEIANKTDTIYNLTLQIKEEEAAYTNTTKWINETYKGQNKTQQDEVDRLYHYLVTLKHAHEPLPFPSGPRDDHANKHFKDLIVRGSRQARSNNCRYQFLKESRMCDNILHKQMGWLK